MAILIRKEQLDELYHHGIKGQKWGVRRFQNKDGTMTAAGKRRVVGRYITKSQLEKLKNTVRVSSDGSVTLDSKSNSRLVISIPTLTLVDSGGKLTRDGELSIYKHYESVRRGNSKSDPNPDKLIKKMGLQDNAYAKQYAERLATRTVPISGYEYQPRHNSVHTSKAIDGGKAYIIGSLDRNKISSLSSSSKNIDTKANMFAKQYSKDKAITGLVNYWYKQDNVKRIVSDQGVSTFKKNVSESDFRQGLRLESVRLNEKDHSYQATYSFVHPVTKDWWCNFTDSGDVRTMKTKSRGAWD